MRTSLALSFACLLMLAASPARSYGTTQSGAEFLRSLDLYANRIETILDWTKPTSPWHPYIKAFAWDVVPAHEEANYLILQRTGRCKEVLAYTKQLFLARFPNLAVAFMNEAVAEIFVGSYGFMKSRGYFRCSNLKSINRAQNKLNDQDHAIEPFTVTRSKLVESSEPFRDKHKWSRDQGWRNSALWSLLRSAVCNEYEPALQDVIRLASRGRMLRLGPELEYYILKLARELQVPSKLIRKRLHTVASGIDSARRVEIDAAVRYGSYQDAKLGLWHCRGPRADRT